MSGSAWYSWIDLSKTEILNNLGQNAQDWLKNGSTYVLILGMDILIVAMVDLDIGYGCFKGWNRIWTIGLLFAFIIMILSLFAAWSRGFTFSDTMSGLIGAIIPIVIILYLNTKKARAWFGGSV